VAALVRSLAVASLVALAAPLLAQPTFKGGTRTVAIYATATDAAGRLAPDLSRDHFQVYDNGKLQTLSVFASDIQPITVVMLLDRSGSMRGNFELVEQAAEEFVREMLPADKARIGSFSNRIQVDPRDFTSDRDELLGILRTQLQEEGPTPLWNAINVGITALLHQQGRRVILVFTDGADRPMNESANNNSLRSVMRRAEEEDVMVYAIGLAGMNIGMPASPPVGWGMRRSAPGPSLEEPDEGLPKIAQATGGGYFELTSMSDLPTTFKRVADELHHQYVLGFTPAVLDGKMHKLDVRVTGAAATVRARRSYRATQER
jgi:VWFA-related protein